jgi:hypothetical protein
MDEELPTPAPAPSKPSQIPSWVSLGFVLGALVVLALPRRQVQAPPALPQPEAGALRAAEPPQPRQLTTIEAVFAEWGDRAVWSNDSTEVALWNGDSRSYGDFYEVVRAGGTYYFRSIPRLTRPVLTHGVQEDSPLQFTETEPQRQEWLADVRKQNWKDLTESARQQLGPLTPPVAKPVSPPLLPFPADEKNRNR